MAVFFEVPRIGKSNNFKQKGGTCWYYAIKMLRTFHGMNSQDANWRNLHAFRKIQTELGADTQLGGDAGEDLKRLESRLVSTVKLMDKFIADYGRWMAAPNGAARQHELAKLNKQIELNKDIKALNYNDLIAKRDVFNEAVAATQKLSSNSRMEILREFKIDNVAEVFHEKDTMTPETLEKMLLEFGPFYASGEVWSKGEDRTAWKGQSISSEDSTTVVKKFDSGMHAVVISGIKNNMIYYKDPNNSAEVRVAQFGDFLQGWQVDGRCRAVRLTCPQQPMNGCCIHVNAGARRSK